MQETHYPRQTAGQLVIPDATRHDSGVKKEPLNLNSGSFFGGYPYWIPPFLCYTYIFWVLSISSCELVTFQKTNNSNVSSCYVWGSDLSGNQLKGDFCVATCFRDPFGVRQKLRKRRASFLRGSARIPSRGGVLWALEGLELSANRAPCLAAHSDAGAWYGAK